MESICGLCVKQFSLKTDLVEKLLLKKETKTHTKNSCLKKKKKKRLWQKGMRNNPVGTCTPKRSMLYQIAEREGQQPRILYSASLSLRTEGEIKNFFDKGNVKRVHLY